MLNTGDLTETGRLVFRDWLNTKNDAYIITLWQNHSGGCTLGMSWGQWGDFSKQNIDGLRSATQSYFGVGLSPASQLSALLFDAGELSSLRLSQGYDFLDGLSSWPYSVHALGFGPTTDPIVASVNKTGIFEKAADMIHGSSVIRHDPPSVSESPQKPDARRVDTIAGYLELL